MFFKFIITLTHQNLSEKPKVLLEKFLVHLQMDLKNPWSIKMVKTQDKSSLDLKKSSKCPIKSSVWTYRQGTYLNHHFSVFGAKSIHSSESSGDDKMKIYWFMKARYQGTHPIQGLKQWHCQKENYAEITNKCHLRSDFMITMEMDTIRN